MCAVLLLLMGIALLVVGILSEVIGLGDQRSFVFFLLSAICLLPGVYVTVHVVRALRGDAGYGFRDLPTYDDED